ncbi:MAG: heparan-alpha-glucosaminide N-acetyltransferase domain-containing protein [Acidobacteriota bacterium]
MKATAAPGGPGRLESLDAFRGLTIAAMILVSTPGTWEAVYGALDHAVWHGWTPTDLIFPFLLFAMGAAVPVALARRRGGRPVGQHVMRRGLMLFGLGLLLNAIELNRPFAWSTFPVLGVLQRIAIVYVAIAWLTGRTSLRTQVIAAVSVLLGYWAAMKLVPVPGFGAGVLTPDGNLASALDRWVLGRHMWHPPWEAEGLLSTAPAIVTALCGVFAGQWISGSGDRRHRGALLWTAGAAATLVGLLWGRTFPINKSLWTSSFALFSAGMAAQGLALCHWMIDGRHWRGWSTPFLAFGRNPLFAYFCSVVLDTILTRWKINGIDLKWRIYSPVFRSWAVPCCGAANASLFYAIAYVAFWGGIVWILHRQRLFVGI